MVVRASSEKLYMYVTAYVCVVDVETGSALSTQTA